MNVSLIRRKRCPDYDSGLTEWQQEQEQKRFTECFTSVSDDEIGVSRRSIKAKMEQQNTEWNIKAQRFHKEKRHASVKMTILVITLLSCFISTMIRSRLNIQLMLYIALIGVIMATDPLGAVGRFLALPSRVLIAINAFLWDCVIATVRLDLLLITIISGILTVVLIRILNTSWLSADNWRDTEAVEKALKRDPDGLGGLAWQAQGKREVHTALCRLGLNSDENTLDYCHRVTFEIGYSLGIDKAAQLQMATTKLGEAREELKKSAMRIQNLENALEQTTEEAQRLHILHEEQNNTNDYYRSMYIKIKNENEQLRTANDELLKQEWEENPPQLKVIRSDKDIVLEALASGKSYQQAADIAGISKSKAYRLGHEYREDLGKVQGL